MRSSSAVSDEALQRACDKVAMMLAAIPDVRSELVRQGVELRIIGRNEQTSDLQEFQSERGKVYIDNLGKPTTIDERTRGKEGGCTRPVARMPDRPRQVGCK